MQFPHPPRQDPARVYREETDHPLPAKLNPGTRYAFFKTIARGGKSLIQSCKDLHLQRVVCHKSLRKELRRMLPPDAAERAKCPSCGKNCLFARGDASCCPEYKQHNGVRLDHEDAAPKPIEEVRRWGRWRSIAAEAAVRLGHPRLKTLIGAVRRLRRRPQPAGDPAA